MLNAHMDTFPQCTEEAVVSATQLKARSRSSTLYYSIFTPDSDSVDAQLIEELGLQGMLSLFPLHLDSPEVADTTEVRFTGTVHKRKATFLEKTFGGGADRLFYEVEVPSGRYLLRADMFAEWPLEVCDEAERG